MHLALVSLSKSAVRAAQTAKKLFVAGSIHNLAVGRVLQAGKHYKHARARAQVQASDNQKEDMSGGTLQPNVLKNNSRRDYGITIL